MNSEGIFGKGGTLSITLRYGDDGKSIKPHDIVSARLYKDKPTDSQLIDHTDASGEALQKITTWANGLHGNEKIVSYSSIADPNPELLEGHEIYWWVLSYEMESGGDTLYTQIPFNVHRIKVNTSVVNVSAEDIYEIQSKIKDWHEDDVSRKIVKADELIQAMLVAKGYDIKRVKLENIRQLVIYKTVILSCLDIAHESGAIWMEKVEKFESQLTKLWPKTKIGYDFHGDGKTSELEEVSGGASKFLWG